MLPRASVPTTLYPHHRQCSDRRPSHPHQFAISCPIYLCVHVPMYIRNVEFTHITSSAYQKWPSYIPEHYRCSLMRALRDVDLHRPATRTRRRVELPNPSVHIPSTTHAVPPTTHRTSTYIQSHQRNHHYRDCLYNITHNTEHKYINLGRPESDTADSLIP